MSSASNESKFTIVTSVRKSAAEQSRVHKINWPVQKISKKVYDKIVEHVNASTNYAKFTQADIAAFDSLLAQWNEEFGACVTIMQALSIRNIVLKDKIIRRYGRMNALVAKIAAEYSAGKSIMILSRKYDFPPLNLLRGILLHLGLSKKEMYNVFANKVDPSTILVGRNLVQFRRACANDAESTFNQTLIADLAAKNETTVVNYFKSLGIGLVTQDELVAQQTAEFGRAIITPDILFTDEVYINGARVHWIDYKDYVCTRAGFLLRSNREQAARYVAKWGPGALCYRYGAVEGIEITDAQILDTQSLRVNLK